MPEDLTILFAGGGTGGHLYPGIAVARALKAIRPNVRPVFLCTTREIDRVILEPTGFEFIPQPIIPPVKSISGLLRFWKSWRDTKDLVKRTLRERQPAAVLGLGGYAAGVAVKVAAARDVPTAILNPDVIPGKANQYLIRYASAVFCQFEATARYVSPHWQEKLVYSGCPIRPEFAALPPRAEAAARLGLDPRLSVLLITGASLGAQTVNEATLAALPELKLQGWQVLHLSGRDHAPAVNAAYRQLNLPAAVIDFTPDMADVFAVASVAICRCGASTCAELTAAAVPAILMPYPYHKDMHQKANAQVLADAGAAVILDDQKDARKNAEQLRPLLQSLLYDAAKREQMATAARALAKPSAAQTVAEKLTALMHAPAPSAGTPPVPSPGTPGEG